LAKQKHPSYGTARLSAALPADVAARVHEAAADPELLSLRPYIAVLEARLLEIFGQLEKGGATAQWKILSALSGEIVQAQTDIRQATSDLQSAGENEHVAAAAITRKQEATKAFFGAVEAQQNVIRKGVHLNQVWSDIEEMLHSIAGLKKGEFNRLVTMHAVMTSEEVLLMASKLLEAVTGEVMDPAVRARIATRFAELVSIGNPAGPGAGLQVLEAISSGPPNIEPAPANSTMSPQGD
jgi:hypothetical protein